MPRPAPTLESDKARWLSKVDQSAGPDACHPWTDNKTLAGYGNFGLRGKRTRAHRAGWALFIGPIPEDMLVCHTCDNPSCCNLRHLFLGTHVDNMQDRKRKGKYLGVKPPRYVGENHPQAKLTLDDVETMRAEFTGARGQKADFARKYGVSNTQIGNILSGKHWPST